MNRGHEGLTSPSPPSERSVWRLWVAGQTFSADYASRSIAMRDMTGALKTGAEWAHLAKVACH